MMDQQQAIREFEEMGFHINSILVAYQKCNGNKAQMTEYLLEQGSNPNSRVARETELYNKQRVERQASSDDSDLKRALEISLREAKESNGGFEPLNPEQRLRKNGMPVGLKNVGNTCYVNSLFQTHFQNYKFVKAIMEFESNVKFSDEEIKAAKSGQNQDKKKLRLHASINLVKNLQTLFAYMTRSHKKYADPLPVLNTLVDDFANPIPIGDQKDVTEFNITFLTRVEEALQHQDSFLKRESPQKVSVDLLSEDFFQTKSSLVRKLSNVGDAEETFMSNIFFGKMRDFRSYFQDSEKMVDVEDSLFGAIILNIAHKDLYTSFDAWLNFEIEDFRAPNGELCKAEKSGWITKAPDTLFIQLQRVVFNKETGGVEKLDSPFNFEKEIYLDRFLFENKDIATEIKIKVKVLKNKLENLEAALSRIQNYKESGLDIISALGVAAEFLKAQLNDKQISGPKPQRTDPVQIGLMEDKETVIASMNTLGQYQHFLIQKKKELENEIKKVKDEIDSLYSQLKKEKYVLGSILIHDGVAGSGHYYSFIRNHDGGWKRYNDIQVSDEKEEVVFKEAIGGKEHKSAYCLVYVSQKSLDEEARKINDYNSDVLSIPDELKVPKQHYNNFLREKLLKEVDQDNKKFHDEIEEYRFQTFMKNVTENYQTRLDILNCTINSASSKQSLPFYINSFGLFLRNEYRADQVLKWYVLDTCLQETDANFKIKLRELKNQPKLLKFLQNSLASLGRNYYLNSLILRPEEDQLLDIKLAEYALLIPGAITSVYILEKSTQRQWTDTLYGMKKLNDMNFPTISYFSKMSRNVASVVSLYLTSVLEFCICSQRLEKIDFLMNIILALNKGVLKQEDPQINQVKAILNEIATSQQNKLCSEKLKTFKDFCYKMQTAPNLPSELDKIVGNVKFDELEKRIAVTVGKDFEPYKWQDVTENSYSQQIKKQFEKFSQRYKVWVSFHNMLHSQKMVLRQEDRLKNNFIVKEEEIQELLYSNQQQAPIKSEEPIELI